MVRKERGQVGLREEVVAAVRKRIGERVTFEVRAMAFRGAGGGLPFVSFVDGVPVG